jgi:hypothetical protein
VAPSLIQDELVRSQHQFDGVDQPAPIHEPVYLGPQQPALSQVLRGGRVSVAEQEDCEEIDMSSLRHGASSSAQVEHFSVGTQLSRPTFMPDRVGPQADPASLAEMMGGKELVDEDLKKLALAFVRNWGKVPVKARLGFDRQPDITYSQTRQLPNRLLTSGNRVVC